MSAALAARWRRLPLPGPFSDPVRTDLPMQVLPVSAGGRFPDLFFIEDSRYILKQSRISLPLHKQILYGLCICLK